MDNKVLLILVDGMRPDGIMQCGSDVLPSLAKKGASCFESRTIMPSVTLPCHTSLFYSVPSDRHGILDNTWHSMVRPLPGIIDVVNAAGGRSAMFYNWEQLRDLGRPGTCQYTSFIRLRIHEDSDRLLTENAIDYLREYKPDFAFLYLGETDEVGHDHGWMSPEYLACVKKASECIRDVVDSLGSEYRVIITADHGGHGRGHGSEMPEDMTIPIITCGPEFNPGSGFGRIASIMDIAPTVIKILGLKAPDEWEGTPLY
ncbi:MAG: alkaline phosphatase family protein [Clostridia bacterium]|nr:alkaline phosphatase family protein [Clostridia bacterium]